MTTEGEQDKPSQAASKAQTQLGKHREDDALRRAVKAYEAALLEYTRERAPLEWAATQTKLGNALQELAKRGDDEPLRQAVDHVRAAEAAVVSASAGQGASVEQEAFVAARVVLQEQAAEEEMDAILERLDLGIAAEHVAMDRLLERLTSRTPR